MCRSDTILGLSHRYGGFALKEIGAYYDMRGSAVSQCSLRFKQKVLKDKKLKKAMAEIARKTGLVEC